MFKRLTAAVFIALAGALAVPLAASAHVLKVDGDIGIVLHINPDDNPVSNVETNYDLSFDDQTGRFSLSDCDCGASILLNGKSIAQAPLGISGTIDSSNYVTFPAAAVYTIRITGTPKHAGAFQAFSLDFPVRVTGPNSSPTSGTIPPLLWIGVGLAIGLVLLAATAMNTPNNVIKEDP